MTDTSAGDGPGEIMLYSVRVVLDSISLNNLTQYEQPPALAGANDDDDGGVGMDNGEGEKDTHDIKEDVVAAGYGSADDAVHHSSAPSASEVLLLALSFFLLKFLSVLTGIE
ncbi:unnamed protein product [Linum trigynum]|uniref:Uncharacterized protein n=1 Tax=Linum trigynum TaxID=586398 RepID=A0AAV2G706_9ROSI